MESIEVVAAVIRRDESVLVALRFAPADECFVRVCLEPRPPPG